MPHPKKKNTRTSKRQRASHFALDKQQLAKCHKCQSPILPHHACQKCGTYGKIKVGKIA